MTEWLIIDLAPLAAARAGLPLQVAVPSDTDPATVTPADLALYGVDYLAAEPDSGIAADLRRLAAKQRPVLAVQQALAEQRWADALRAVDEVLAIDPHDAPARLNRAAALRESGDAQGALVELEGVASIFADVPLYHRNRARIFEDLGDTPAAVAAYRDALDLAPSDPAVIERLRVLGAITTVSGPGGSIEVDRDALADLVRRDLAMHDDDHLHLAHAARALLAEGQPDLAATAAALTLAVVDSDESTRLVLIEALLAAKRPAEALSAVDRHVAAEPMSAVGHEYRAIALARLERGSEARAAAVRALELDPTAEQAGRVITGGLD